MRKTIKLAVLGGVMAMLSAVSAQTVSGSGARRCGDFLEAVRHNSGVAINGYLSWAQGFISAHDWLKSQSVR